MTLHSAVAIDRAVSCFNPLRMTSDRKADVADETLSAMQSIGQSVHFAREATIFSEGDPALYSYKVVSGTVRVCKMMSDGRRQIAEFVGKDEFFGFEWLDTYSLTAEALEDVVVMRLPRARLDRLSDERRDVQRRLMSLLSHDLHTAQNHLVLLGRQTAKERVASFLLSLAARSRATDGGTFDIPMCRQDIADYLGLTIETVSRTLSQLERDDLIDLPTSRQIRLKDIDALRDLNT